MGKNFATTLRHVAKDQRIYAVKLMNDVLFEAQLGNLNRHWTLFKPNKQLEGTFPQPEYFPQNSSLTTDVMSQSLSAREKSNHPHSPDYVPSVFQHVSSSQKRKGEQQLKRFLMQQSLKEKRRAMAKKADTVDVFLELSAACGMDSVQQEEPTSMDEELHGNAQEGAENCDQMADADMDDPLNITAPTVKEEITFKEEALDESEAFIDPGAFSVPTGKVRIKRERDSSEETETATEGETPTYGSEDDWVLHSIGRKSYPQRLRDPLEDVRVSCNEPASQNIDQKISAALRKDENPTKRLRRLEKSSETEDGLCEGGESDPLGSGLPESEEILLEKETEMKKKEIEMRKKALEVMHRKVDHGDITAENQDLDSSVIELLKSDLHVAIEELEFLLQQRKSLFNGEKNQPPRTHTKQ